MRRVTALVGAAAVALWATAVFAQAKNFSGTWTVDQEKTTAANPAPAGGGGGGGGRAGGGGGGRGGAQGPMTVKQDATTLSVERQGQNGPTTTTYTLDGKAHKVTMGQGEADVTAKVVGSTIEIETTRDMGGTPATTKQVWSMDGDWLVIASTNPPRGGGEATTRKTYYKKG
ncbi:MAG TPA: hypothetical protein VFV78_07890 [Vicinamibacterales bacterium]|nr:hypothetical protein [Vicinamibacterales bacterium]